MARERYTQSNPAILGRKVHLTGVTPLTETTLACPHTRLEQWPWHLAINGVDSKSERYDMDRQCEFSAMSTVLYATLRKCTTDTAPNIPCAAVRAALCNELLMCLKNDAGCMARQLTAP